MVGLPGFEPESIEPKSTSLDQASRIHSILLILAISILKNEKLLMWEWGFSLEAFFEPATSILVRTECDSFLLSQKTNNILSILFVNDFYGDQNSFLHREA